MSWKKPEVFLAQKFIRTPFTWLAYLILAFYGYYLNIYGPITPYLKDELGLTYTVSSLHFTAFAAGILIVGFFGHILIEKVGRRRSLWIGAFGISLSAFLLLAGTTPVVTIGASLLMGTVGSLILAVVPSALSDQYGEQRAVALSEANVVSSFFSTIAPLLVGWFVVVAGSWRWALATVALAPILMLLVFRKTKPAPARLVKDDSPIARNKSLPGLYWVLWMAIVLAVSVEFCMIYWSADYFVVGLGMQKVDAAQAVSLFLAAMIVGRLGGSLLVQRFAVQKLVLAATLAAGVGFIVFWKAETILAGLTGLFITGLGVASMYPLILSMAMGASNGNSVQASARATLASGTAILLLPLILGRLADSFGIHNAYAIVAFLLLGVFLIVLFAGRHSTTRNLATVKSIVQGRD